MKKIGPPHSHHLAAAEGWLGLGNSTEARAEFDRLPKRLQKHPAALEVLWTIHALDQDWELAVAVARMLVATAPESSFGWIHYAYALRRDESGGLQAAWDILFLAMDKFPKNPVIPYNLACYACQMQQPDKARILLVRALKIGNRDEIKLMALGDSDLKPLWGEIASL